MGRLSVVARESDSAVDAGDVRTFDDTRQIPVRIGLTDARATVPLSDNVLPTR